MAAEIAEAASTFSVANLKERKAGMAHAKDHIRILRGQVGIAERDLKSTEEDL